MGGSSSWLWLCSQALESFCLKKSVTSRLQSTMAVRLSVGAVSNSLKRRFMVLGLNLKCPCTFCTHVWYMRSKLFLMMSLILKSTSEFSSFRQILTMQAMRRRESWTRRELRSFSSHGVTSPASSTQSFRQGSVTFHFISCRVDPRKSISSSFIIIILTTSSMIFPKGTPYMYGSDWPPSQMRFSNTCELQLNSPSLKRSYAAWYRYLTWPSPWRLTRPYRFSIMFIVRSHNMNQYELARRGKGSVVQGRLGTADQLFALAHYADELVGSLWGNGYFWWRMLSWYRMPRLLFLISGSSLLLD